MNRKKEAKEKKKAISVHPYDNMDNWLKGDFQLPPWGEQQIKSMQERIDSAWGGKGCIELVWSGDRTYGDEFYTDWHYNGQPKGRPERKPVLLFGEFPINDTDYVYVSCPRWVIMEIHHGSQLEDGWEESSWVADPNMSGGRKRIRTERPPEFFYVTWRIVAAHEGGANDWSLKNPCCSRLWYAKKKICYGNYREPDDADIAFIRAARENMDRQGISQRNDAPRDANVIMNANLATKHFIKRAEQQQASAAKEFMLANVDVLCGDILQRRGSKMSAREMERIVAEGLDKQEYEKFSKE